MALTDGDKKWLKNGFKKDVLSVVMKVIAPQLVNLGKVVTENKMDHEKRIVRLEPESV